ncbi:hypothetical protein D3C86_1758160 [compost metagenome]
MMRIAVTSIKGENRGIAITAASISMPRLIKAYTGEGKREPSWFSCRWSIFTRPIRLSLICLM